MKTIRELEEVIEEKNEDEMEKKSTCRDWIKVDSEIKWNIAFCMVTNLQFSNWNRLIPDAVILRHLIFVMLVELACIIKIIDEPL